MNDASLSFVSQSTGPQKTKVLRSFTRRFLTQRRKGAKKNRKEELRSLRFLCVFA
jgi:hypothetical protein